MGKKKDEPEEAEPEPEPEPEETPEEKEEMAQDILGQMADGIVAERERDAAARPIAVADALGEAMSVLSHRFTHHDTGSSVEEQQGSTWTLDDEPPQAELDSWARGSVPVKIRPKLKVEDISDEEGIPGAMSTGRSMRSARSRGSRASGSRASKRSNATEGSEAEKILVAHSRPVPPKPANKQEEKARAGWKELKDKEAAVAAVEAAYADERKRIKGVLEDLKGTEYGYNHKGEIIMLESVNSERLPSKEVNLRVGLWSEADAEEDVDPRQKRKKKKRGRKGQSAVGHEQSGSIETAGALQGPVAESIEMGSGVMLRSGENEKRGPPRAKDPLRMSRKDYAKMLSTMGGFEDHGLGDTTKTWDDAKEGEGEGEEEEEEEEEEVDWMEEARPVTPEEEPEEELPVGLKNHMEFNQSIMAGQDGWGTGGAPQSYRPVDPLDKTGVPKQLAMAVGPRPRMPRERAYDKVPGITTSEMKRLPAPVFPASKGHGFGAIGYLGGEKSFVEAAQQQSFIESSAAADDDSKGGVELPPISSASQGPGNSFSSANRSGTGGRKRRSFNNTPPSHVHTLQPQLARKYLGVART